MKSIKDIYRLGHGPSSSHTIAPARAAQFYKDEYKDCDRYEVTFTGSLALTGKGHHSDSIVEETLAPATVSFTFDENILANYMYIQGYKNEEAYPKWTVLSLGGGSIRIDQYDSGDEKDFYEENTFTEIKKILASRNISLLDYVLEHEENLIPFLEDRLDAMLECVKRGLGKEGLLNKELGYYRSAKQLYEDAKERNDFLFAYSYAVGEENAEGTMIVTAPTLGAAGVVASTIAYLYWHEEIKKEKLVEALAIGAVFGNLIKQNASIAGSVGGCQAEIGTATAMAAAIIAYVHDEPLSVIERAAEICIEHQLGLTCDPVKGYVIIPCIERNAVSVIRAFTAHRLARSLSKIGKKDMVSFDRVVSSMNYTGKKLAVELRETSLGGLALEFVDEKKD